MAVALIHQRWEHLLFLHWAMDADSVQRLLPPGLRVDRYEGRAYAALVPFDVPVHRVQGLPPLPPVWAFHEVNARTYVKGPDGTPGVWFFSLSASSALVTHAARLSYSLPYHTAEIRFEVTKRAAVGDRDWMEFSSRPRAGEPPEFEARYGPADAPRMAEPGTLEHFLVERYVLFAWTGSRLLKARVRHTPYPLQPAVVSSWQERLLGSAGLSRPDKEPLAHYASGVSVDIELPQRV